MNSQIEYSSTEIDMKISPKLTMKLCPFHLKFIQSYFTNVLNSAKTSYIQN